MRFTQSQSTTNDFSFNSIKYFTSFYFIINESF